ncbi:MAG: DNA polymerase IV [Caulobacteraceae bacterium]|nr:DNA polymerase IV [Caulobacteraceae bacterium]
MSILCRDCLWFAEVPASRCPECASPRLLAHPELMTLHIAHLDCDAFYASVEKRDRPELRDRPVIVGGGKRGVVTTACYIARLSGVRSAMPMFKARRLCPEAVILPPDFARYRAASRLILEKLRALTPLVQSLSLDEAWLDLSGTERLHGAAPAIILARLQREIQRDLGLGVSIGLAPNRFLAKVASDLDKPKGFAVIGAEEAERFLAPRPISILPGVGPVFARALEAAGLRKIGDLARTDPHHLADRWGAHGARLADLARGRDTRAVEPDQARKSLSAETTFNDDLIALAALEDRLWPLCDRVARQVRSERIAGRVVTLKLRTADFRIVTRRRTLPRATQTAKTLFAYADDMLKREARGGAYRLIGVGLSGFVEARSLDGDLFAAGEGRALKGETAVDRLRARFGPGAVVRARNLGQ